MYPKKSDHCRSSVALSPLHAHRTYGWPSLHRPCLPWGQLGPASVTICMAPPELACYRLNCPVVQPWPAAPPLQVWPAGPPPSSPPRLQAARELPDDVVVLSIEQRPISLKDALEAKELMVVSTVFGVMGIKRCVHAWLACWRTVCTCKQCVQTVLACVSATMYRLPRHGWLGFGGFDGWGSSVRVY